MLFLFVILSDRLGMSKSTDIARTHSCATNPVNGEFLFTVNGGQEDIRASCCCFLAGRHAC